MKKIYMVPSVTVMEFDGLDVIATSRSMSGPQSNIDGGPTSGDAPRRRGGIWDE